MSIITKIVKPKRSQELVAKIIPILIRWARLGLTNMTYNDLNHALGYTKKYSGIGRQLGDVKDVLDQLRQETGERIPTLNGLCNNSITKLPSDGFDYVYKDYSIMPLEAKRTFVAGLNAEAINYEKWDWVLEQLELTPLTIFSEDQLSQLKKPIYGKGGEGEEHKSIKEFIFGNPQSIGVASVMCKDLEYGLPSGDRLDVYFENKDNQHIAVEVKPSTAPDSDITRGIFQCIKYKSVMDAAKAIFPGSYENKVLLVIAGTMSQENKQLANELGVTYIEKFEIHQK